MKELQQRRYYIQRATYEANDRIVLHDEKQVTIWINYQQWDTQLNGATTNKLVILFRQQMNQSVTMLRKTIFSQMYKYSAVKCMQAQSNTISLSHLKLEHDSTIDAVLLLVVVVFSISGLWEVATSRWWQWCGLGSNTSVCLWTKENLNSDIKKVDELTNSNRENSKEIFWGLKPSRDAQNYLEGQKCVNATSLVCSAVKI